jgi:hypothetical protein
LFQETEEEEKFLKAGWEKKWGDVDPKRLSG